MSLICDLIPVFSLTTVKPAPRLSWPKVVMTRGLPYLLQEGFSLTTKGQLESEVFSASAVVDHGLRQHLDRDVLFRQRRVVDKNLNAPDDVAVLCAPERVVRRMDDIQSATVFR